MAAPLELLRLLWLLALDAGAELGERIELEELELATAELEELELNTAVLLTWSPELPLDELPPQLVSAQAQRKLAPMKL